MSNPLPIVPHKRGRRMTRVYYCLGMTWIGLKGKWKMWMEGRNESWQTDIPHDFLGRTSFRITLDGKTATESYTSNAFAIEQLSLDRVWFLYLKSSKDSSKIPTYFMLQRKRTNIQSIVDEENACRCQVRGTVFEWNGEKSGRKEKSEIKSVLCFIEKCIWYWFCFLFRLFLFCWSFFLGRERTSTEKTTVWEEGSKGLETEVGSLDKRRMRDTVSPELSEWIEERTRVIQHHLTIL